MSTALKKGQKMKFVVSSAEEAVKHIRAQLGPEAKVLSVRQVEGKGLAKFLTAPKLEIIATLPDAEPAATTPAPAAPSPAKLTAEDRALLDEAATSEAKPVATPKGLTNAPAAYPAAKPSATVTSESRLLSLLRSAGFDASVIRRFENSTDWEKLQRIPIKTALNDITRRLSLDYSAVKIPAPTQTMAFIGTSGVGKTTALCKQLAHEVFFERRSVQVYKIETDATANADTALSIYCEVMGVPFVRDSADLDPKAATLIDTTGVNLSDPEELQQLKAQLDALKVTTRVWVFSATSDNSFIDRSIAAAEDIGATHSVYTHLDEIPSSARLWQFFLSGNIPPLFGSIGPGVAHDRLGELGSFLIQKTFPEYLVK